MHRADQCAPQARAFDWLIELGPRSASWRARQNTIAAVTTVAGAAADRRRVARGVRLVGAARPETVAELLKLHAALGVTRVARYSQLPAFDLAFGCLDFSLTGDETGNSSRPSPESPC
jgi:membrane-associated phospholipid phosphatase